jgi:hypothetical protein
MWRALASDETGYRIRLSQAPLTLQIRKSKKKQRVEGLKVKKDTLK